VHKYEVWPWHKLKLLGHIKSQSMYLHLFLPHDPLEPFWREPHNSIKQVNETAKEKFGIVTKSRLFLSSSSWIKRHHVKKKFDGFSGLFLSSAHGNKVNFRYIFLLWHCSVQLHWLGDNGDSSNNLIKFNEKRGKIKKLSP